MSERVRDCLLDRPDDRIVGRGQPVVDPETRAASVHEARAPEHRQVPRGFRLGDAEALVNVAHAHLAGAQQPENPQTGGIAQRPADVGNRRGAGAGSYLCRHIFTLTYITRQR